MGISNVYCNKERSNSQIYCRIERCKQKDPLQAVFNPADPRITKNILKQFQHVTSLDLNMGYYHIRLTPPASSICTIILLWGKYEYLRLPMGLCNSPDIFQEKMSDLMGGLEFTQAYIDDLLILSTGSFSQHLTHSPREWTQNQCRQKLFRENSA